jgi:hypothetical protein
MNTNTVMRNVLAAAAAGALVLGSAGAATAGPDKAKGPKVTSSAGATTKLAKVDIKGHKKIDLAQVDETTAVKLRAKVRYSKKTEATDALASLGLKLAVYDKKVNGMMVEGSESSAAELALKTKSKAKKNQFYAGEATILSVWTEGQVKALADAVAANGKAYICISSVDTGVTFDKYSTQTRKRLAKKADGSDITRKPVRECVKVVNSAVDAA